MRAVAIAKDALPKYLIGLGIGGSASAEFLTAIREGGKGDGGAGQDEGSRQGGMAEVEA